MDPLVPSTPDPTKLISEVNNPKYGSVDLGLGLGASFKGKMAVKETRVNDKVTLADSSMDKDKVILAEAPVTPITDRENARSSVTNLTPLTSISSGTRKSDFGDFSYDEGIEWNEKVAEKPCSDAETPEQSTFDPFASGPEELIFAPKKCHKPMVNDNDEDDDGQVLSHSTSRPKRTCNIQKSKLSVARTLCFDSCLDSEDETHSSSLNTSTAPSSANTDQYDSLVSAEALNLSSQSRSRVVRVLDLHYEKHPTPEAYYTVGPVNDNDRQIVLPGDDDSNEETFIQSMCGSFLEVILSKQCEDAKLNISDSGVKDASCYGLDQQVPGTPVTPNKGFSREVGVCPGAPIKARPKSRLRGAALGSVCRKLEF